MNLEVITVALTEVSHAPYELRGARDYGVMKAGARDYGVMRAGARDYGVMRAGARDYGVMTPSLTLGQAA